MELPFVNIHTHRPTGRDIELRTAGIHPWDAGGQEIASLAALLDTPPEACSSAAKAAAAHPAPFCPSVPVQAIGETGLDFACDTPREAQYAAFRAQLQLACKRQLPVVLHCVRAFEEVMREVAVCRPRAVIFHGFIGSPEQARRAIAEGYYLSFGARTFSSPKTLSALRETPLTHLFFETDDSDIPIEEIYARASEATGRSVEELQRATLENYNELFT